jgi:primosomal protein N' (replication factor Y)
VISAPLLAAIRAERVARGEQSLVLLNRRGYAPVLHCADCGWKSGCPHCSAWRVFHKIDRTLRCHHCGFTERVPRACPGLRQPRHRPAGPRHRAAGGAPGRAAAAPDGTPRASPASTPTPPLKGALEAQLAQVHAGEVDVLVGTQMIAKGHDFRRITLVAAVNPDGALFSSDFRAPERLFALLMQAGRPRRARRRPGRAASEMWVQTWHPQHPLFEALQEARLPGLRRQPAAGAPGGGLPPFSHLGAAAGRGGSATTTAGRAMITGCGYSTGGGGREPISMRP